MADIVRYYIAEKNPDHATFPFQPLSDITADQWADLNENERDSVDAAGFWHKTKPRPAKDEAAPVRTRSRPTDVTQGDDIIVPLDNTESEAV